MSSRLFKHQMAATNKPPTYPQLAIGYQLAPFMATYNFSDGKLSGIAAPFSGGAVYSIDYTKDGKFVLVYNAVNSAAPLVYRRDGSGFIPYSVIDSTQTNQGRPIPSSMHTRFSDDGLYMFCAGTNGQYMYIFKRNDEKKAYERLLTGRPAAVSETPEAHRLDPTGTYLAIGYQYANLYLYKRNGDDFSQVLARPDVLPPLKLADMCWSPNGKYLFCLVYASSPINLVVYRLDGEKLIKVTDNSQSLFTAGRSIAVSPDGQHIAVTGINKGGYAVYKFDGQTLVRLSGIPLPADLGIAANGGAHGVSYSEDGKYLAMSFVASGTGTPGYTLWRRNGDSYEKLDVPGPHPSSGSTVNAYVVAFGPKAA